MWPFRSSSVTAQIGYAPVPDGRADPGEVCWAWVPFEDDPSRGKDRPVLIIGVAIDHFGHRWLDVGTGAWDHEGRPSEVRLDRLLRLSKVRREGAALDEAVFRRVLAAVRISDRR